MPRKKKAVNIKSEEEILKEQLNNIREEYCYIPNPTIMFNIGEQVRIGNLKDCVINKIIDGGKIYLVDYTEVNNNYGNPIITEHCKRYFVWLEIAKLCNNKYSFVRNNDLKLSYSQRHLGGLLTKVYNFGVNFNPDYQRDFVWELEDNISLINSIFNNVDIGQLPTTLKGSGLYGNL